jgi:hypothetical protein
MKQFQNSVAWDLTLAMIECLPSGNGVPSALEGLCVGAKKFSGTVPDAVVGVYAPGAAVHNVVTGVWYRMTGTTNSPAFSVWAL